MNPSKTPIRRRWRAVFLVLTCLAAAGIEAQSTQGVSPGSSSASEVVAGSCPTFSWTGTDTDEGYQLVLYRLDRDGTLKTVLETEVRGGARSWTPAAAGCPDAGGHYAWAVRGITGDGTGQWSEPLLFETPVAAPVDELRQALEVLWKQQRGREVMTAHAPDKAGPRISTPKKRHPRMSRRSGFLVDSASADRAAPGDGVGKKALAASTITESPSPQVVTSPAGFALHLAGDVDLGGFLFKDGQPFIHNNGGFNTAMGLNALSSATPGAPYSYSGSLNSAFGDGALRLNSSGYGNTANGASALGLTTTGILNTAHGLGALFYNMSGSSNTASGAHALVFNEAGSNNTAHGADSLRYNTASGNTAVGARALRQNTSGTQNTATGNQALSATTSGSNNTAHGAQALLENTTGGWNTAVGSASLLANTSGSFNTAIGFGAGLFTTGGDNIAIGHGAYGVEGEDGAIRIGGTGFQDRAFIAGIHGATAVNGISVFINSANQLGTSTSSARFKQDIRNLEGVTEQLLDLRPVSFRYKDDLANGVSNPLEYGLIAEEVAEIFPELVVNDEEGRPYTVRYHLLTPLLLGEYQRQEREIEDLRRLMAERNRAVADLRRRLDALTERSGLVERKR